MIRVLEARMLHSLSRVVAQFWNRTRLKKVHSCETTVSIVGSRYRTSTLSHTTSVPIAAARVTSFLNKTTENMSLLYITHAEPLARSSLEQETRQ
jgi:hypothetical protein